MSNYPRSVGHLVLIGWSKRDSSLGSIVDSEQQVNLMVLEKSSENIALNLIKFDVDIALDTRVGIAWATGWRRRPASTL